jgi:hypothetical protein
LKLAEAQEQAGSQITAQLESKDSWMQGPALQAQNLFLNLSAQ